VGGRRRLDFGDGQGKVGALVPVADMLNHHTRAPLASASYDETTDSIVFSALAAVPAGSQLRLFYGPLPGAELLLQYGFLDDDALPAEAVRFDVEPPDADSDADALKKAVLLACGRYTASHFVTAHSPCPPRLLGALRVCLLDGPGLAASLASGIDLEAAPASAANEAMVWSALGQLVGQMRASLAGGSAADDEALLAGGAGEGGVLPHALATIVRWRLAQKRALDAALECVEREGRAVDADATDGRDCRISG